MEVKPARSKRAGKIGLFSLVMSLGTYYHRAFGESNEDRPLQPRRDSLGPDINWKGVLEDSADAPGVVDQEFPASVGLAVQYLGRYTCAFYRTAVWLEGFHSPFVLG